MLCYGYEWCFCVVNGFDVFDECCCQGFGYIEIYVFVDDIGVDCVWIVEGVIFRNDCNIFIVVYIGDWYGEFYGFWQFCNILECVVVIDFFGDGVDVYIVGCQVC